MSQLGTRSSVAVFDAKELRRACITSFLEPWAKTENLRFMSLAPEQASEVLHADIDFRMLIFSVGGESIAERENLQQLKVLRALATNVPLVIISDREDGNDIAAAFSIEAQGYIYSGITSALACQALSFILHGGSYFPPSATYHLRPRPEQSNSEGGSPGGSEPESKHNGHGANGDGAAQPQQDFGSANLTTRQRQVLEHIRLGESNKLIARRLGMTEGTVKVHVRQMMRKCGASNRTQLALGGSSTVAAETYSPVYDVGAKSIEKNLDPSFAAVPPTQPTQGLTLINRALRGGPRVFDNH